MAGKKQPKKSLSKSAKYYRDHPEARKKKQAYDAKLNRRPEQRKKRSQLVAERRKRGIYGKGGKDVSHEKGGTRLRSVKSNRGNSKNTKGDRNARGKSKK